MYLDSTARLKLFTYVRRDQPYVELFPDRNYPLFASNRSTGFKRTMTMDSSGTSIEFSESVRGEEVKIPVSLSFHDYVSERMKYESGT